MRWLFLFLFILIAAPASAGVRVVDGDTLEVDGVMVRLNGIDAPETWQTCGGPDGEWRCGDVAADRLAELTAGREVTCAGDRNDGYGRLIATCRIGGEDIGAAMVRAGLAWAFVRYDDVYLPEERAARAEGRGVWSGPALPAWEVRAERWRAAEGAAPGQCPIKGNISRGGRIYHTPWSRHYDRTRIDTSRGERWFCTEAEALAAGWRAPFR